MSEGEGAGQPQQYCRNCGAEVRPGSAFCMSCGASVASRAEGHEDSTHPRPTPLGRSGSFIDAVRTAFQRTIQQLRRAFSVFRGGGDLRSMTQGARRWFKDLPVIPKAVLVGLVSLVLSVLLSPLTLFAALLLFGVSVIVLIVRARQRRSEGRWSIVVALASLVLVIASLAGEGAPSGSSQDTKAPENKKRLGSGDPASYDVVVRPSEISVRPPRARMMVAAPAADRDDLKAVCQAVSKELGKRYPQYEVVIITVRDRAGPDSDSIGIVAYFENEYAKRDYTPGVTGPAYSASCGP